MGKILIHYYSKDGNTKKNGRIWNGWLLKSMDVKIFIHKKAIIREIHGIDLNWDKRIKIALFYYLNLWQTFA